MGRNTHLSDTVDLSKRNEMPKCHITDCQREVTELRELRLLGSLSQSYVKRAIEKH